MAGRQETNLYGAVQLIRELAERGEEGSVVTLICDPGERYLDTYYSDDWLKRQGYDIAPYLDYLRQVYSSGGGFEPPPFTLMIGAAS